MLRSLHAKHTHSIIILEKVYRYDDGKEMLEIAYGNGDLTNQEKLDQLKAKGYNVGDKSLLMIRREMSTKLYGLGLGDIIKNMRK